MEQACEVVFNTSVEAILGELESRQIDRVGLVKADSREELAAIVARGYMDIPIELIHNISILEREYGDTEESDKRESADLDSLIELAEVSRESLRATALGQIAAAALKVDEARAELDEKVLQARRAGVTWADIGGSLGVSQQAVNQRWGKLDREAKAAAEAPTQEPDQD